MDNVGAMYRLEGAEDLVNKVLDGRAATIRFSHLVSDAARVHLTMIVSKMLRPYDAVQVRLHKFLYNFLELKSTW